MKDYIIIHSNDNVAVALKEISKMTQLDGVELQCNIPAGHKYALKDIIKGESIIKYGYPIGYALKDIKVGEHVHTHNLKTSLSNKNKYEYIKNTVNLVCAEEIFFNGYRRKNGKVGIRNEIWIIPTVGCVNNVALKIAEKSTIYKTDEIDDIVAFPHPFGCSQMGEDQENTRNVLARLINHPNAAAVLVLGLGCENCNIAEMKKYIGNYDEDRVKFLNSASCEDEITESVEIIKDLCEKVKTDIREKVSCKELIIGLKCGGSDGFSGITANPVVGEFSDLLIAKGGTTILTEVPEMFGAETILMNRCKNQEVFNKTVNLINNFKDYFESHNQVIYENPSPGNKEGGISTLEEKSLGCTQKSGSATVIDVIEYGKEVKLKGLNLLNSPGNDLVAATALAAAGAHIVLFTTGRGTPFACPVPTVKMSSNSDLSKRKKNWIDFDCSGVLMGESIEDTAKSLFEYVIKLANGEKVKAEENGYHDMAIFKQGVTL